LDELLGGGIENEGRITELYRRIPVLEKARFVTHFALLYRRRKTNTIYPDALYVDTENTFRPERIASIASARKIDPKHVLEKRNCCKGIQ
jgi:DNA repair protein RadA